VILTTGALSRRSATNHLVKLSTSADRWPDIQLMVILISGRHVTHHNVLK